MLMVVIGKFNCFVIFNRKRRFVLPATLCRNVGTHACISIGASQQFLNKPLAV